VGASRLHRSRSNGTRITELDERLLGLGANVDGTVFAWGRSPAEIERGFYERRNIRVCAHMGASLFEDGACRARFEAELHQRLLRMLELHDVSEATAPVRFAVRPDCLHSGSLGPRRGCLRAELVGRCELGCGARIDERLSVARKRQLIRCTAGDREQSIVQQLVVAVALCRLPGYAA